MQDRHQGMTVQAIPVPAVQGVPRHEPLLREACMGVKNAHLRRHSSDLHSMLPRKGESDVKPPAHITVTSQQSRT